MLVHSGDTVHSKPVTNGISLTALLTEKRYELIEESWLEALADPVPRSEYLIGAIRGLARAGQKSLLQSLAGKTEAALKLRKEPAIGALRWTLLKEAVRAGATPSTPDGFSKISALTPYSCDSFGMRTSGVLPTVSQMWL